MKVPCGQCPAKYAILDERIQGKKVRIDCKRCGAAIVVDGKTTPPTITTEGGQRPDATADSMAPENPRPEAKTMLGGLEAPMHLRDQRRAAAASPATPRPMRTLRPAAPEAVAGPSGMPAPGRGLTNPPAADDAGQTNWRVALTEHDLRWMTTDEVVAAYNSGALKPETFVLRQGMAHWQTLLEVAEFGDAPASSAAPNGKSANGHAIAAARPQADSVDNEPEPFALIGGRPGTKPVAQLDESFLTLPFTDAEPIESVPAAPAPALDVATPVAPAATVALLRHWQYNNSSPRLQSSLEHPEAHWRRKCLGSNRRTSPSPKNHPIRPAPAPLWPWLIAAIVLVVIGVMVLSRV